MTADDDDLEALLGFVRDARGFDFSGYKRASIARRVRRRMDVLGIESIATYRDLLEADVDEFTSLFNTILINVTGFFRDPAAWTYVAEEVIPAILSRRPAGQPIRLWSAGCASGEEAYTLAMLMAEHLGLEDTAQRVKVYGTDVDLEALAQARSARYPESSLVDVPEALRERYFVPDGRKGELVVVPALRRAVVFGRNDLVRDPPISRIDLLSCRNTLMYFSAETQAVIIPRLHYALRAGGYLILGRAEMVLPGRAGRFTPVDTAQRVFAAVPTLPPRTMTSDVDLVGARYDLSRPSADLRASSSLREAAFDAGVIASLLVSPDGIVLGANEGARDLFSITPEQIGGPLSDLRVSFEPVELRAPIETALAEHATQNVGVFRHGPPGRPDVALDVRVLPLLDSNGVIGVNVTFVDVTHIAELHAGYGHAREALETAYEELEATNEELEATNEELQSANEELETTNEELRSSNEQLEPTNVDLRLANDAVERINATLVQVNDDLNESMALHRRIMDNLPTGVVVLDARLLVQDWNQAATELWGLFNDEVRGKPFFALDIGLPLEPLQAPVRAALTAGATPQPLDVDAVNRRGQPFTCQVLVLPVPDERSEPAAMLVMRDASEEQP